MAESSKPPCIYVLAGTNGAGKSSMLGEMIRSAGGSYYNPDEAAQSIAKANPGRSQEEINSAAWFEGKRQLERAIDERLEYGFETTLGGYTITGLLENALSRGIQVRLWYVGLSSAELHILRVRQRVRKGGHDIPEDTIRARYINSRANLIQLLSSLTELRLFDNSQENDLFTEAAPEPMMVLHMKQGQVVTSCDPMRAPEWTRPIFDAIDQFRGTKSEGQSGGS